ncbi:MAG: flagellar hook-basal body complex protein FliE [Ilumatobacter sp.]
MTIAGLPQVNPAARVAATTSTAGTTSADGAGFADKVSNAIKDLNTADQRSSDLATAAATGDLDSLTSYVVAATEAQLATQITVAVRNKAVDAFNQIMGMPI